MRLFALILILGMSLGCTNGNDFINEVPVLHARVISSQHDGCDLMIITDGGIRAELEIYSCYHTPGLQAGDFVVLEVWGSLHNRKYIYKSNREGNLEDFAYYESNYEHLLD